jgi:hypothetical protein
VLLLATGFDSGNASQIRWHLIGREGLHIHFDQADEWAPEIWPLAAAAIDDDADACDMAAVRPHNIDRFLDSATASDDVFGHDEPFVRPDLETAQHEAAGVFLDENVALPERAPYFLADDDSAEGRGNDGIAFDAAQFLSKSSAHVGGNVRVLKEQRALKKLAAVQTGAQDEMAVQQRAGLPEEREQILVH